MDIDGHSMLAIHAGDPQMWGLSPLGADPVGPC
jgi:hypothetical protein